MKKSKKYSFIFLITFAIATIGIIINKLVIYYSSKRDQIYQPNSNYYNWRFGKVHYSKTGQGSPILLIHDLDASQSGYEFKSLAKKLETKYTVYTIDLLGFGKSDKPKTTYTNFLFVQLVNDFITTIIKQKTNIVCIGNSTTIGLSLCNFNSLVVNKLIFINAPSIKNLKLIPRKNQIINKKILDSYLIGTSIYNIEYSQLKLKHRLKKQAVHSSIITPSYVRSRNESAHIHGESSKYVDASIRCYYTNQDVTHAIKSINNSIYIINGIELTNNEDVFKEYTTLNSAIETALIDNSKGLPWIENTKDLYNYISLFLL